MSDYRDALDAQGLSLEVLMLLITYVRGFHNDAGTWPSATHVLAHPRLHEEALDIETVRWLLVRLREHVDQVGDWPLATQLRALLLKPS